MRRCGHAPESAGDEMLLSLNLESAGVEALSGEGVEQVETDQRHRGPTANSGPENPQAAAENHLVASENHLVAYMLLPAPVFEPPG